MILVAILANAVRSRLDKLEGQAQALPEKIEAELSEPENYILVIGFGQVGMAVTRHLLTLKLPVTVLDLDAQRVRKMKEYGLPVNYGNALRLDVLLSEDALTSWRKLFWASFDFDFDRIDLGAN
jgi:hypothetical protein